MPRCSLVSKSLVNKRRRYRITGVVSTTIAEIVNKVILVVLVAQYRQRVVPLQQVARLVLLLAAALLIIAVPLQAVLALLMVVAEAIVVGSPGTRCKMLLALLVALLAQIHSLLPVVVALLLQERLPPVVILPPISTNVAVRTIRLNVKRNSKRQCARTFLA